jgi:hypothetical protein
MRDTPKKSPDFFVSVSNVDFLKAHIKISFLYNFKEILNKSSLIDRC